MEKRKFEKLGIETSLLGFGCMRFPATPDGKIDEPRAEKLLDRAIAAGVNYIDTAYPYHNGDSEPFVGKVLQKYDRNSFYLATKLPVWAIESVDDAKRIFAEQLERLRTDHIDFYLMHAMSKERWDKVKELGIVEFCEQLKAEGKSVIWAFPSTIPTRHLKKCCAAVTGISARFSITTWTPRSRQGIKATLWQKSLEFRW